MRKQAMIVLVLFFAGFRLVAQQSETILNYISTYKDLAMEEMRRTGVPASIKLAQGIHETQAGTSALVLKSNNHFGIKCKSNWTGMSVTHDDDARGECFRKYESARESYRDHSNFLVGSRRYGDLFKLDPLDYAGWANGLKAAGYATNPKYPQVLIKLIEDYNLQQYTQQVLNNPQANAQPDDSLSLETVANGDTQIPGDPPPVINYPAGEFRINDTRVVWVKKGTSYLSLANKYNLPLSRIFEFNEMQVAETADADQLIYLQRKRKTGATEQYTVQPCETLYSIAQAQGIRLESLCELNYLSADERPAPGEKLNLKTKAAKKPALVIRENYRLFNPVVHNKTN